MKNLKLQEMQSITGGTADSPTSSLCWPADKYDIGQDIIPPLVP